MTTQHFKRTLDWEWVRFLVEIVHLLYVYSFRDGQYQEHGGFSFQHKLKFVYLRF
jgi:hypothetical protein